MSDVPEFAEMVDLPGDVRAFSHHRRAGIAEVTPGGRVRLDTLARWAQDVAWADVADVGLQALTIWLVRRTTFRINRFPRLDERYRLTTSVTGTGRMWAERRTDLVRTDQDGAGDGAATPDVQVACIWVHIDPERLQPSSIHQIEYDTWTGPHTRSVRARLRHPSPAPGASEGRWTFRAAELDVADHINNAAYWTPLDDELVALAGPEPAGAQAEIEYRTPAQPGPKRWLVHGAHRWLVDPDAGGEVNASIAVAFAPAAAVSGLFASG